MQNIINKISFNKKKVIKGMIISILFPLGIILFNSVIDTIFKLGTFIGMFLRHIFNFVVC